MKKFIILPFLLLTTFCFSQTVDTLLGVKGKLIKDTSLTIDGNYLFIPSRNHLSFDSTKLIWFLNGSKVYTDFPQIGLGSHTPRAKFMISDSTGAAGDNDSTGILLTNDTTALSPSLTLNAKAFNSAAGIWEKAGFRVYSNTLTSNPTTAILHVQRSVNGGAYTDVFTLTSNGVASFANSLSAGPGTFGTSVSVGSGYFLGYNLTTAGFGSGDFISMTNSTASGTAVGLNIKPSINSPKLTGVLFNPTVSATGDTATSKITPFQNVIGDNKFNTTSGSSGFGVPDASGVNGSAMVEINSTVKGFLLPRMTKAQRNNIISSLTGSITSAGSGYSSNGSYANVALSGGTGTGALATIYARGSVITAVKITNIGSGYVVGDVLTAPSLPSGSGFTYTISAVGVPATGLMIWQTDNTPGPRWFDGTNWNKVTLTTD